MVKQVNYVKSNLIYPESTLIEDTYIVVIKRAITDEREDSLKTSLKEFIK
jgi:hypothetical protein